MCLHRCWIIILISVALASSFTHAAGPTTRKSDIPEVRPAKVHIVLAGDSTVTDNAGWGKGFADCFGEDVQVINMSRGGRSSKSFIAEGRWAQCLALKPDYILIQFGHNDSPGHPGNRETDPNTTYRQYMTQYIDDARKAGIKPVLVTSLSRRQWGTDGLIHSTLVPYVEVVTQIAAEKNVPLIDLHARSIELYEKIGKAACEEMSPRKQPTTDAVTQVAGGFDGTHLNAKGGQVVGRIVADELKKAVPDLASLIK
jgi:pectinesterase